MVRGHIAQLRSLGISDLGNVGDQIATLTDDLGLIEPERAHRMLS